MIFEELDRKMRLYEESLDQVLLPELYMVARLDGRSFTRLTKEICRFEAPFDIRFRDMMIKTVRSLMNCGFRVVYGFTESDEISLLFHPEESTFGRKVRKYNSTLAGVASATFSLELGQQAVFDCRMIPLPTIENVQDYFLWRQEDAHRNSLNSYCYWKLRENGATVQEATRQLEGKTVAYKNELLFQNGVNYDTVPNWQKRGIGVWFSEYAKEGYDPVKGKKTTVMRRELHEEYDLAIGEQYAELIEGFCSRN